MVLSDAVALKLPQPDSNERSYVVERLDQLRLAYATLSDSNTVVLAVPVNNPSPQDLAAITADIPFPVATQGAPEIARSYGISYHHLVKVAGLLLELGLVNRVVPQSRLIEASMSLAHESCKGAPGAIARSKKLLDELSARPISLELNRSIEYHLAARASAEAQEGAAAFFEKRLPRWGPRPVEEISKTPKEPQE